MLCPLHTPTGLKQLLKPELGVRANQGSLIRTRPGQSSSFHSRKGLLHLLLWVTSLGLAQVSESSLPHGGTLSPARSYANSFKAFCFFWLSIQRSSLWPSTNLLQRHFSFQMLCSGMIPKQQHLGRGRGTPQANSVEFTSWRRTNLRT